MCAGGVRSQSCKEEQGGAKRLSPPVLAALAAAVSVAADLLHGNGRRGTHGSTAVSDNCNCYVAAIGPTARLTA